MRTRLVNLQMRSIASFMVIAVLALFSPRPAPATSTGIVMFSGKQDPRQTCAECHAGGTAPLVEFSGPTVLAPGAVGTFQFRVQSQGSLQIAAGFNVAACFPAPAAGKCPSSSNDAGQLSIDASQQGQVLSGEITHTTPKHNMDGVASWQFTWQAPSQEGTATLYGAGNSVNLDGATSGDRSAATTYSVMVSAVTPTPSPTATRPPTTTPTLTPTHPVPCVGDCNSDHRVTIDELLLGVDIALDDEPISRCDSFDTSKDQRVNVNELVAGVGALIHGCLP